MEVIQRTITSKSKADVYRLYPLGDVHAGSKGCAESHIRARVAQIKADPLALWVGMGDMADAIIVPDKRYEPTMYAPWVVPDNVASSQRKWLVDLLRPITSKCVCYLTGNHEQTIHKRYQQDITRDICDELAIPYGGYSSFINLSFDHHRHRVAWLIHAWHGAGAAQSEGARILRLMRLVNDIQADVYLMGHLHAVASYTPSRLWLSPQRKIKSTKLIALMTGSWLRTYGQGEGISYGEEKGYRPSSIGCPCICFKPSNNTAWLEG